MTEGDKTKEGIEGKEKTMYIQANLHFGPCSSGTGSLAKANGVQPKIQKTKE